VPRKWYRGFESPPPLQKAKKRVSRPGAGDRVASSFRRVRWQFGGKLIGKKRTGTSIPTWSDGSPNRHGDDERNCHRQYDLAVAETLLRAGANANAIGAECTPLYLAVVSTDEDMI
jgi:hypothetical protein